MTRIIAHDGARGISAYLEFEAVTAGRVAAELAMALVHEWHPTCRTCPHFRDYNNPGETGEFYCQLPKPEGRGGWTDPGNYCNSHPDLWGTNKEE